jgi:hypothetical protein
MEENHQPHHQTIPENRITPFNTGLNILIVTGPSTTQTKYGWLCVLLEWTNNTRHDIITRNLWPTPDITTSQELNTMPMHDKQWGTDINSWKYQGTIKNRKHGRIHQQN